MPLFENLFHRKVQAPVDKEKSSGGSSSSLEQKRYENIEAGQTWITDDGVGGQLRIHIDSIDPPSASRYGVKYKGADAIIFYDDISKLKKELADGQFELVVKKKKKRASESDEKNTGSSEDKAVKPVMTGDVEASVPAQREPSAAEVQEEDVESQQATPSQEAASASSAIFEQLTTEREALTELMAKFDDEIRQRGMKGWVTSSEEARLRAQWYESDEIIRKTLASFQEKKDMDVEEAKKELQIMKVNLPIVRKYEDDEEGLDFFVRREFGSEEAEVIENALRDAREEYFKSFEGNAPKDANRNWKKYVLPELEKSIMEHMSAVVGNGEDKKKMRMLQGAIQIILSNIADSESK